MLPYLLARKRALFVIAVAFSVVIFNTSFISGASDVADEDCLACHENFDRTLAPTTHRLSSTIRNSSAIIECVSCHTGAPGHLDDPGLGTIGNPGTMEPVGVEKLCTTCHESHMEAHTVGFDPHTGLDISCTSCHKLHGNGQNLLIDEAGGYCGTCHVAVVNEFRQRSNHPLAGQNVACTNCHNFVSGGGPEYGHGSGANCSTCHPQESGPFLFEHEAANSFTPEGGGCVACHEPHGSSNERLLTQPDNRLCLQCHGTPPGHLTAHGGQMAGYACMDCHSDIHGSYDNRLLLDPQLGSKLGSGPENCFCHYYR